MLVPEAVRAFGVGVVVGECFVHGFGPGFGLVVCLHVVDAGRSATEGALKYDREVPKR